MINQCIVVIDKLVLGCQNVVFVTYSKNPGNIKMYVPQNHQLNQPLSFLLLEVFSSVQKLIESDIHPLASDFFTNFKKPTANSFLIYYLCTNKNTKIQLKPNEYLYNSINQVSWPVTELILMLHCFEPRVTDVHFFAGTCNVKVEDRNESTKPFQ